jgi:ANTAR domain
VANSSDLIAVMAELHAALRPGDLAQTLRRVTDAAVELLPDVDGASITVEHEDGRFETAAATGSVEAGPEPAGDLSPGGPDMAAGTAERLDRVQQALGEGPAVDVANSSGSTRAMGARGATGAISADPEESEVPSAGGTPDADGLRVREPTQTRREDGLMGADPGDIPEPGQAPAVRISDMSRDDRYPAYGAVAMRAGVRAQVAVVLFDTDRTRGVLNLYSLRAGVFDDTAVLTDLFAHHSATALAYAAEYHDRETTVAERRAIGQALGIVMERYTLSESDAYALLQQTAEHRAVSVRLVAQELVARAEGAGSHE